MHRALIRNRTQSRLITSIPLNKPTLVRARLELPPGTVRWLSGSRIPQRVQNRTVTPSLPTSENGREPQSSDKATSSTGPPPPSDYPPQRSSMLETAITALMGVGVIFIGGILYVAWYKENVLLKVSFPPSLRSS